MMYIQPNIIAFYFISKYIPSLHLPNADAVLRMNHFILKEV